MFNFPYNCTSQTISFRRNFKAKHCRKSSIGASRNSFPLHAPASLTHKHIGLGPAPSSLSTPQTPSTASLFPNHLRKTARFPGIRKQRATTPASSIAKIGNDVKKAQMALRCGDCKLCIAPRADDAHLHPTDTNARIPRRAGAGHTPFGNRIAITAQHTHNHKTGPKAPQKEGFPPVRKVFRSAARTKSVWLLTTGCSLVLSCRRVGWWAVLELAG